MRVTSDIQAMGNPVRVVDPAGVGAALTGESKGRIWVGVQIGLCPFEQPTYLAGIGVAGEVIFARLYVRRRLDRDAQIPQQ